MTKMRISLMIIGTITLCLLSSALTYFVATKGLALKTDITIMIDDEEKIYDGLALEGQSYQIEGEINPEYNVEVSYHGSITNVGKVSVTADVKIFDDHNDISDNYNITVEAGELTINKRPISVKVIDENKIYNGSVITSEDFEITEGSLAFGHYLVPSFNGFGVDYTPTPINVSLTCGIIDINSNDVTSNYEINEIDGLLTIDKAPLIAKSLDEEKVFDGKPLEGSRCLLEGELPKGFTYQSTYKSSITEVGSTSNEIASVSIYDTEGNDVSNNFVVAYQNVGTLSVTPYTLSIDTLDQEFTYSGKENSCLDFEVATADQEFLDTLDYHVDVASFATIISYGSKDNVLGFNVISRDGVVMNNNFLFDIHYGTLDVKRASIVVRANDVEMEYTGEEILPDSSNITYNFLCEGHTIDAFYSLNSKLINVGQIRIEIEEVNIYDANNNNVTNNYQLSLVDGYLTVIPKSINIETKSVEKIYDGLSLSSAEYTVNNEDNQFLLEKNLAIEAVSSNSMVYVGQSLNTLSYKFINNLGDDVSSNFRVVEKAGVLTIKKREITITLDSIAKMYDGIAVDLSSYTVSFTEIGFDDGETPIVSTDQLIVSRINGSIVNVGTEDITIQEGDYYISNILGVNVKSNYNVKIVPGTIEITKRPITVAANDYTTVYTGTSAKTNGFTCDGLLNNHRIETIFEDASHTNAGTYSIDVASATIFDLQNQDVTSNYNINYVSGELVINKRDITIYGLDFTSVFTGVEQGDTRTSVKSAVGLLSGDQILIEYGQRESHACNLTNTENEILINKGTMNVTSNYQITFIAGSFIITPAIINITTNSGTFVYDGLSHTAGYTKDNNEFDFTIINQASIINAGSVVNEMSFSVSMGGEILRNTDYQINAIYGILTVTKVMVTIEPITNNITAPYNGMPLSITAENIQFAPNDNTSGIASRLVSGHRLIVTSADSLMPGEPRLNNASIYGIDILDSYGNSALGNYDVNYRNMLFSLSFTQYSIDVSSSNMEKVFDGYELALVDDSERILYDVFVSSQTPLPDGHYFVASNNARGIYNVYESGEDILFTIEIYYRSSTGIIDVTTFFDINYLYGIQTIKPLSVIVTTGSASKVYDGSPLVCEEYYCNNSIFMDMFDASLVTYLTSITEVGSVTNYATFEDSNFDIMVVYGTLTILPEQTTLSVERIVAIKEF